MLVESRYLPDRSQDRFRDIWRAPAASLHVIERFTRVDANTDRPLFEDCYHEEVRDRGRAAGARVGDAQAAARRGRRLLPVRLARPRDTHDCRRQSV